MDSIHCLSNVRMIANPETSAAEGLLERSPTKSLYAGGAVLATTTFGRLVITLGAVALSPSPPQ